MNKQHLRREPLLVTLPLEKLHVATNNNFEPVQWITIPQRSNIFFVYECVPCNNSRGEQRIIKVTSGAEVMELMDLDMMAHTALTERSQISLYSSQTSQQDICALVKSPMIAMRYRTESNQTRTFQMRFTNKSNYATALQILELVQFPIKPAAVTTVQRPTTAKSATPVSPASPMWGSQHASQLASRALTSGGSLSNTLHRPLIAQRTASRRASLQRPSTAGTVLQRTPQWTHGESAAMSTKTGAETDCGSWAYVEPQRPQTSYQPTSFNSSNKITPWNGPRPPGPTNAYGGPLWSSSSATLGSSLTADIHSYPDPSYSSRSFLPPSLSDFYTVRPQFSSPLRQSSSVPETPQTSSFELTPPQTAVAQTVLQPSPASMLEDQQTLSQLMPPRRELPFARPALGAKPTPLNAAPNSRPSSATLDLPELPKPTPMAPPTASNVARQGSPELGTPIAKLPAAKPNARKKAPLTSPTNPAPAGSQEAVISAPIATLAADGPQSLGKVVRKRKRPATNLGGPPTPAPAVPNPGQQESQTPAHAVLNPSIPESLTLPPPGPTPTPTIRRRGPKKLTIAKVKAAQVPLLPTIEEASLPLTPMIETTDIRSVGTPETAPTPANPILEDLQEHAQEYIDRVLRKHAGPPSLVAPTDENFQSLASLSAEDRQTKVETIMCGLLHDEEFYKLVECVENSWVRIGFDLS